MRRDHRERFSSVLDDASGPIFLLDPEHDRIVDANGPACAMLEYPREELRVTPISTIHPAEMPQMREFTREVIRHGQGWTVNLTCRTKSGRFLPAEMFAVALDDSEGHTCVFVLVQYPSEHRGPGRS